MRRAALLSALLVLVAGALPAEAPARRKCHKRACKGKVVRAKRAGIPQSWIARGPIGRAPAGPGTPQPPGGSTPQPPAGTTPAPPPPPPPPLPPEDPRYLQVVARDAGSQWALEPSRPTLLSGSVSVEFNNRFAEDPHDLKLRHGGTTYAFPTVGSGDARTQAFALDAGPWRLWCSLPGHAAKGMDITVTVSDP